MSLVLMYNTLMVVLDPDRGRVVVAGISIARSPQFAASCAHACCRPKSSSSVMCVREEQAKRGEARPGYLSPFPSGL